MSKQKIIFFRIGWMNKYEGLFENRKRIDKILNGGEYVVENESGNEIYNFKAEKDGYCYGFGQPWVLSIGKLGAKANENSIDGVTVVWVATHPDGGQKIIGWYKNATVFRKQISIPNSFHRPKKKDQYTYNVIANKKDCTLLETNKRFFPVEGFGRSNVWYALGKENEKIRVKVLKYIKEGTVSKPKKPNKPGGHPWQKDTETRQKIERIAVDEIGEYYENLGYKVISVEKENKGWDLEANKGKKELFIEVKGTSQNKVYVELTPNEYRMMKLQSGKFILGVVTNALEEPRINIFVYNKKSDEWYNLEGDPLTLNEKIAATAIA